MPQTFTDDSASCVGSSVGIGCYDAASLQHIQSCLKGHALRWRSATCGRQNAGAGWQAAAGAFPEGVLTWCMRGCRQPAALDVTEPRAPWALAWAGRTLLHLHLADSQAANLHWIPGTLSLPRNG